MEILTVDSPPPIPITKPAAPATDEKPPTAEELKAMAQQVRSRMFDEPPAPAAPAVVTPPAPAAIAPASPAPPAPTPPAPAPPPEPEPTDLTATIQRTAKLTADAVVDRLTPPPLAPEPPAGAQLSDDDARDLQVLRYMAENDPKAAALPDQFLAFCQKAYKYQDDWQAKNEGETFSWDDSEHSKWYDQNAPSIDREAMTDARADMRAEAKFKEKMQPEIDRQKAEREWEQARPVINNRVNSAVVTMVDSVAPELGKLLRDANGNPNLGKDAVDKVEEADPVACDILTAAAAELVPMMAELEKVDALDNYNIDPNKSAVHAAIVRHAKAAEADILKSPSEQQIFDGKQFTSIAEMQRLRVQIVSGPGTTAQKNQKIADLEASRTCLSAADLKDIIRDDVAGRARAEIERRDAIAKKKYHRNGNGAPAPAKIESQDEPAPEPAPATPPAVRPATASRPPVTSSESDALTPGNPSAGHPNSLGKQVVDVMFK